MKTKRRLPKVGIAVLVLTMLLAACAPVVSTTTPATSAPVGGVTSAAPTTAATEPPTVPAQVTQAPATQLPATATTAATAATQMTGVATQATEAGTAAPQSTTAATVAPQGTTTTGATMPAAFRENMRKLWEDHIMWTRLYIVSFAAGLPDADAVAARLMQNQVDIGDAIKPYYGDDAGNQLTTLLKAHISGAVDVLKAAKSGDNAALDKANAAWADNGKQIAAFLNKANPDNWPLATMQSTMQMHLDLTLA